MKRRRLAGVHWLVTHGPGLSYLHETDITGYSLWGDRDRAKRYDDWDSRRIVKLLRTGNGMMRAPIKDARRVKVKLWYVLHQKKKAPASRS